MENVEIIEKGSTDSVSLGITVKVKYIDDDDDAYDNYLDD